MEQSIPPHISPETVNNIIARLWPEGYNGQRSIYALIDSAHDPDIFPWINASQHASRCLYREPLSEQLRAAAPYIVELSQTTFTRQLLEKGWGQSWCLFLAAPASMSIDRLSQHCRKLNIVKGPSGEKLYFRYYDPRVMNVYLPTCTQAELDIVFGPITDLFMESTQNTEVSAQQCPQLQHVHYQHHVLKANRYPV